MTNRYDAIVIGAGHNGLICAATLAKAGKTILLLEANDQVGGAAVTREFADGFRVSACAHFLYQLQPEVRKELNLTLPLASEDMTTISLSPDGHHVRLNADSVSGVSTKDADEYRDFRKRMLRFADLLGKFLHKTPPRLGSGKVSDLFALARMGFDLRRLGKSEMQEFLRVIGMNIYDEVSDRFSSPFLKGAISLDAVLGTHLGPRSPNTIMTYLYRLAGDHGRLAVPTGGMGSVTDALATAARNAGVTVQTSTPVTRIIVENGRVAGVETTSGDRFDSLTVISSVDPKQTALNLVGAQHFESGFAQRIHHFRTQGNAAKLHLALDGLPAIPGLARKDFATRMVIAADENYVERAFNPAKYGECSPHPVIEISFPSFRDESLAPTGKHILSAVVQYAPYELKDSWHGAAKKEFEKIVIKTLAKYMPDIEQRITATELLTPLDIEREFHITGGHWHHGELTLDQFLFLRPVAGAAQYRMPLDGLYLCGAGSHPGGGVSGAPGRNAARAILKREKSA